MTTNNKFSAVKDELEKYIVEFMKSKAKGLTWVSQAADMLGLLAHTTKEIEAKQEKVIRPIKIKYDLSNNPFVDTLNWLKKKDKALREAVLRNYKGEDSILTDTVEISFRTPWTYDVVNLPDVPKEYLTIDTIKVTNAIKEGVRILPGISIHQTRRITVTLLKSDAADSSSDKMEG